MSERAARPEPPRDGPVELCAFRVGDEEYVIDLRRVREVVTPTPITAVPRGPPGIEGVMSLRGAAVPIVDVRKRLGIAPVRVPRPKVLVVDVAGRALGLLVDSVVEVVRTTRSAIGKPPAVSGLRLFLGVCGPREARPGGRFGARPARLRLLLDVKMLLEEDAPSAAEASRREALACGT